MVRRDDFYEEIAAALDPLADVPDDVLFTVVTRDGLCFQVVAGDEPPELTGEDDPDRDLAARFCAGCPVQDECLELELRIAGEQTVGVWGALSERDRRSVYRVWKIRHPNRNRHRRGEGGEWS